MKRMMAIALAALALAACSSAPAEQNVGSVVVEYLQARIDGDADKLRTLLCAANESNAAREAASFASVEASLNNVACTFDAASAKVSCTGSITATYNGENREIPLPKYQMVQEDGEWRVCGETD
jgi:hypothetical protein